jgi:hypothetical protein
MFAAIVTLLTLGLIGIAQAAPSREASRLDRGCLNVLPLRHSMIGIVRRLDPTGLTVDSQRFDVRGHRGLKVGDQVEVVYSPCASARRLFVEGGAIAPQSIRVGSVERILPENGLRIPAFTAGTRADASELLQGPGCWLSTGRERYEFCAYARGEVVAMRWLPNNTLHCATRLTATAEGARWTATRSSCRDDANAAIQGMSCDGAARTCRIERTGAPALTLAFRPR